MTPDEEIEKVNKEVYGGSMPAHNKEVLRSVIEKENSFWEREAVREDSHSPVGDWNNMREVNQE